MSILNNFRKIARTTTTIATAATVYNQLSPAMRDKVKQVAMDSPHQVTGLIIKMKDQFKPTE